MIGLLLMNLSKREKWAYVERRSLMNYNLREKERERERR